MNALLRKPLCFAGVAGLIFIGMTVLIWWRISTSPQLSYQLGFPGWLTIHKDSSGWSFQGVDNRSLALQIALAILATWIVAKTIDWKPMIRRPGSLGSITIGLRVQAVIIVVLVGLWYLALLIKQQQGENAPVVVMGLFALLPLLTTLLALIVLETRIRYRERGPWWAYLSIFVGLVPWIWWAWYWWASANL